MRQLGCSVRLTREGYGAGDLSRGGDGGVVVGHLDKDIDCVIASLDCWAIDCVYRTKSCRKRDGWSRRKFGSRVLTAPAESGRGVASGSLSLSLCCSTRLISVLDQTSQSP
jgi:hypothetical protein